MGYGLGSNVFNSIRELKKRIRERKGKIMEKIMRTFAAVVMVLGVVMLAACGGLGNKFVGTWYSISDPGEVNPGNYEFKSNGTVLNDGVEGRYSVDGNSVTVNFFDVTETYYYDKYEGCDALFYEDQEEPFAVKSLSEAERLNEEMSDSDYEEEGYSDDTDLYDDETEPEFLTEEEAFEQEGYFIKTGDGMFKPLHDDTYRWYDSVLIYPEEHELPVVSKASDKIVYMSSSSSLYDEEYFRKYKIKKEGYAFPMYIKSYWAETAFNDYPEFDSFSANDVVSINGDSFEKYAAKHNVARDIEEGNDYVIFDGKKDENITVKYREGTAKEEIDYQATAKFWVLEKQDEVPIGVKDTDYSYVELDMSDMKPGYYEISGNVVKVEK